MKMCAWVLVFFIKEEGCNKERDKEGTWERRLPSAPSPTPYLIRDASLVLTLTLEGL